MEVLLKNVHLAFAQNIFEAGSINGSDPAFSAKAIFDEDSEAHKALLAAEEKVAKEKWGDKAKATLDVIRKKGDGAVKDGDLKPEWDGFEGHLYANASGKKRPTIIDRDQTPLAQSDGKPYGGCTVNMMVDVWAQDNQFGKKINNTLTGLQFVKDGDAFAAGAPAADASKFPTLAVEDDDDDLLG